MGILGGKEILKAIESGDIVVDPFDPANLNPVSLDLRLGNKLALYKTAVSRRLHHHGDGSMFCPSTLPLDMSVENKVVEYEIGKDGWVLVPGILYLMHTVERVCARRHVPILDGKSSVGRLGIKIHETAGFGDPGFDGQYTLEVTAVQPVRVFAGVRFCQIRFHEITGDFIPYSGNYVGERAVGPVPSRAWRMFG